VTCCQSRDISHRCCQSSRDEELAVSVLAGVASSPWVSLDVLGEDTVDLGDADCGDCDDEPECDGEGI